MTKKISKHFLFISFLLSTQSLFCQSPKIGAFFFDVWSPNNWKEYLNDELKEGDYFYKLVSEYPEREPAYGWVSTTPTGIQQQIDDAQEAGLDFFIFDWYYCRDSGYEDCLMNNALDLFMQNPQHEMKFTSMITNDTFNIGPAEWQETKTKLKEQFIHPAYFKVDDRPVVYIYLGTKMIDAFGGIGHFKKALKEFKKECREFGIGEPLIGIANIVEEYSLRRLRFADFLFTYNQPVLVLHNDKEPIVDNVYSIDDMIESEFDYWFYLNGEALNKKFVPTITAGWDRRPWDENTRVVYTKPTREYIKKAVKAAIEFNEGYNDKSLENMILIYAWNEYAEGGYISRMKNGEFIGLGIKDAKNEDTVE